MKQEDKDLLLKDLCRRLPYSVILQLTIWDDEISNARLTGIDKDGNLTADVPADCAFNIEDVKPYLRPMSSMTEEERVEYLNACGNEMDNALSSPRYGGIDYLNANHFDYHNLIERGLAIEVTEDNNPYKN